MAADVLAVVRLIFPCDTAMLDSTANKWTLKNPRTVVLLPPEGNFPIRVRELWIYVQCADGIGEFDLALEMHQILDEEKRRWIGRSESTRMEFQEKLLTMDTAFHITNVPFRESGVYEFRMVARMGADHFQVHPGRTAELLVLDRRTTL